MEKSLFEQMGGTYSKVGDYSLPNLLLPQEETKPIGLWGQRHARYLKRSHKVLYMYFPISYRRTKPCWRKIMRWASAQQALHYIRCSTVFAKTG